MGGSYLVDTADSETERATLDTGAVHVVTNKENKLKGGSLVLLSGINGSILTLSSSLKRFALRSASPASDSFLALCRQISLANSQTILL